MVRRKGRNGRRGKHRNGEDLALASNSNDETELTQRVFVNSKLRDVDVGNKTVIAGAEMFECGVCEETMNIPVVLVPCQHRFCSGCILSVEKCPQCGVRPHEIVNDPLFDAQLDEFVKHGTVPRKQDAPSTSFHPDMILKTALEETRAELEKARSELDNTKEELMRERDQRAQREKERLRTASLVQTDKENEIRRLQKELGRKTFELVSVKISNTFLSEKVESLKPQTTTSSEPTLQPTTTTHSPTTHGQKQQTPTPPTTHQSPPRTNQFHQPSHHPPPRTSQPTQHQDRSSYKPVRIDMESIDSAHSGCSGCDCDKCLDGCGKACDWCDCCSNEESNCCLKTCKCVGYGLAVPIGICAAGCWCVGVTAIEVVEPSCGKPTWFVWHLLRLVLIVLLLYWQFSAPSNAAVQEAFVIGNVTEGLSAFNETLLELEQADPWIDTSDSSLFTTKMLYAFGAYHFVTCVIALIVIICNIDKFFENKYFILQMSCLWRVPCLFLTALLLYCLFSGGGEYGTISDSSSDTLSLLNATMIATIEMIEEEPSWFDSVTSSVVEFVRKVTIAFGIHFFITGLLVGVKLISLGVKLLFKEMDN